METENQWRGAWEIAEIDGKLSGGKTNGSSYELQGFLVEVCGRVLRAPDPVMFLYICLYTRFTSS